MRVEYLLPVEEAVEIELYKQTLADYMANEAMGLAIKQFGDAFEKADDEGRVEYGCDGEIRTVDGRLHLVAYVEMQEKRE